MANGEMAWKEQAVAYTTAVATLRQRRALPAMVTPAAAHTHAWSAPRPPDKNESVMRQEGADLGRDVEERHTR